MGLRVADDVAVSGPRPTARGRAGASLDYGAASIAALQARHSRHSPLSGPRESVGLIPSGSPTFP